MQAQRVEDRRPTVNPVPKRRRTDREKPITPEMWQQLKDIASGKASR